MVALNQIRVTWSNLPGFPGVSTFYSVGDVTFAINKIQSFFDGLKARIPAPCVISYPTAGNVVDSGTGLATAAWTAAPSGATTCTGGGNYAAPVGAVVNWHTGLYVGGRELRGKTFIVPLTAGQFAPDGTLDPLTVTALQTQANGAIGGGNPLHVWGKTAGANAPVTAASVPDKAVVLRSRRA